MTEADPDAIGPDGRVRLRAYLPSGVDPFFRTLFDIYSGAD